MTKKERDIQLIEACILEKWNPLALGCEVEGNAEDTCVLCQVYNESSCTLCPIKIKTGYHFCGGSPYDDYARFCISQDEELDAIEKEIEFLISLLPKSHIWRK